MDKELLLKQFDFADCEIDFVGLIPEESLQLGDCNPTSSSCGKSETSIFFGDCQLPTFDKREV